MSMRMRTKSDSEWGTCNFNYYRERVCAAFYSHLRISGWRSFTLTESVWMRLVSMRIHWSRGDSSKGINEGALDFIQFNALNSGLQKLHPSVMLIAEDSTNFPKVTAPVEYDGLGLRL